MPITTIRGGRQIADGTIPYVDIQNVTANTILGNNTAGAASIQEIALAASQLLGRGVTGNITAITAGTGLAFSGNSIAVSANLASLSALSFSSASFVKMTAAGTFALDTTTYEPTITAGTTAQYWRGDKSWQTLNTAVVPESGNLYYTDARARASLSFTAGSGAYNSSTGVITIPTNTNQLTNGAGFITGYTETDTLASVTGRGSTTTIAIGAPNFYDATGSYNVNLGSGGSEGRGLVAGYSGSSYAGIGYNVRHTTTGGSWIAPGTDTSSYIAFTAGGFIFYGAPSGTAGRTLSYGTLGSFTVGGVFNAVNITVNSNQVLHAANYNSYAPTLTGGGASGTWGISISGNAATASTATTSNLLFVDNTVTYGRSGLQFAQSAGPAGNTANAHQTPTGDWWHILRMNHANGAGYYADLAVSLTTNTGILRRVISNGGQLSNWVTILDTLNYNSYTPTLTGGGASGTWSINVSGTAASESLGTVTSRGFVTRASSGAFATNSQGTPGLEIYGGGGTEPAYMTFHRPGMYALRFGLDGTDVKVGGWSAGNVSYKIWHEGNLTNLNQLTNGPGYITGSYLPLSGGTMSGNIIMGQATSPNSYYLQFGDNTGWTYRFMTLVSSTPTVRFSFKDDGTFTAVGDVIAYSDARVKTNVATITDPLDKVTRMRGVTYNRTDSTDTSEKVGVIAQEIQQVLPQVVTKDNEGMLGVSYGNLAGVFIEAIKEQQRQIEDLKKQIEYLAENR